MITKDTRYCVDCKFYSKNPATHFCLRHRIYLNGLRGIARDCNFYNSKFPYFMDQGIRGKYHSMIDNMYAEELAKYGIQIYNNNGSFRGDIKQQLILRRIELNIEYKGNVTFYSAKDLTTDTILFKYIYKIQLDLKNNRGFEVFEKIM